MMTQTTTNFDYKARGAEIFTNKKSQKAPDDDHTEKKPAIAIQWLKADADLRKNLATAAYERVMAHYTWAARAEMIRAFVSRSQ
jgi:glycosyltransferase involved in cell wall biosynthesis